MLSVAVFELNKAIWQDFFAFLVTSYIRLSWNKEKLLLKNNIISSQLDSYTENLSNSALKAKRKHCRTKNFTTRWLCEPNLETSQPELNLPSISYQFGSSVLQSKARESALQTATASRPLQPGTIHILCQHMDWVGSENGDFCWFSVLYLCWHSGWVGPKKSKNVLT